MSGSDRANSPAPDDKTTANPQRSATPARNHEMSEIVNSPARRRQSTNNSSTLPSARLGPALAYSQKRATSADNDEMGECITLPARTDRDIVASAHEVNAGLERTLAHFLTGATPVHRIGDASASASMAHTREEVLTNDQSTCPLFRLPPELRNAIYTYVVHSKYDLPQFQWDEEHDSPKLSLKRAQYHAPQNALLQTCRSIYAESKGIFVAAKTQFWSDTTFTLTLPVDPPLNSFGYLERLLDDQVNHITRLNIDVHGPQLFTVHLRSGPEATWSVSYCARAPGCSHSFLLPAPLTFVKSVGRVQRQLNFRDVIAMLWRWSSSPRIPLCAHHQPEPVVLSTPILSRKGLMSVVAWACDGPRCNYRG